MSQKEQGHSISQLASVTGHDRRTISGIVKGLGPVRVAGRTKYYLLSDVEKAMSNKPSKSLKEDKLREEIRKLRIRNDRDESRLVDKEKNDAFLLRVCKGWQSILRQKLCNELPSNAAKQEAPAIAILAESVFNKTMQEMKKFLQSPELRAMLEKDDGHTQSN